MSNPHDALFKFVFSEPDNAAPELRAVLPSEISARLDWSSLALVSGSFVDERLRDRHSDLLFSVRLDGRQAFVYVLLEHQSTSDPLMVFRVLRYVVRVWESFVKDNPKTRRLPAVIPVVVHHSESGWSAPIDLAQVIDLDAEVLHALSAYVPHFQFLLDDLAVTDDQALRARSLTALGTMGLLLLQRARHSPDLLADLHRWADVLVQVLSAPNGVAAFAALLEYAFRVGEVDPEDLHRLVHELGPIAEEAFMTAAQKLTEKVREEALAKGRAEGRAEGKAEGKAELVLRLVSLRFGSLSEAVSARILLASPELLDLWAERVLTAQSLDELLR